MRILVTNDDGIYAPGLRILAETLKALGDVTIVAPDRNCSGASSSLTLDRPIRINDLGNNYISVQGTPTDCVHLAVTGGLLPEPPDIVVSGINAGSNLGDDVFYSGTVAAAMEGRFMGISAVAVSLAGKSLANYQTAASVVKNIVTKLQHSPALPRDTILNVNVPDLSIDQLAGITIARLGTRRCAEPTIKQVDPRGNNIFWIGLPGPEEDAGPGTDFHAIKTNYVSITPIQLDMTNYKVFDQLSNWVSDLQFSPSPG